MDFKTLLNNYIDLVGCTAKELSDKSNISTSVISRYRNGERIPKYDNEKIKDLIKALTDIANENSIDVRNIENDFMMVLNKDNINIDVFRNNFNIIINTLNINNSELSKFIGFDSSYISKIRSGVRKPQNINDFALAIVKYLNIYYNDDNSLKLLSSLIDCDINLLKGKSEFNNIVYYWICNNNISQDMFIKDFLFKLDDFDLNDYIKKIKFDKLKVPTIPFTISKSKNYYGLKGFKDSQIDILKTIVFSKYCDDVLFYSNMPMMDASKDKRFVKRFMFGLALMLKKGIHLNMIHNLDRPFKEILLGLEGWIPIYMTGNVNPYYFSDINNGLYSNLECISGIGSLSGSCINNDLDTAKFYLTTKSSELNYYKERSKLLLKNSKPLMDIYNIDKKDSFIELLYKENIVNNNMRNIYSTLPIYTISDSLLNSILDDNEISDKERDIINEYVLQEKIRISNILSSKIITDEICILDKDEFNSSNIYLSLANIYFSKRLKYSYQQYLEHIELIKKYKKDNNYYNYKVNNDYIFKNINISIIDNNLVIISKENIPSIHFVIHHSKLVNAIDKL